MTVPAVAFTWGHGVRWAPVAKGQHSGLHKTSRMAGEQGGGQGEQGVFPLTAPPDGALNF